MAPVNGILLLGLSTGVVPAMLAVGLVLIYRTHRIVNFALAGAGILGGLVCVRLVQAWQVPWGLAVLAGAGAAALVFGLSEYLLARRFERAPRTTLTIATIGLAQLLLFAEAVVRWASSGRQESTDLRTPLATIRWSVGGVILDANSALLVLFALAAVTALTLFLSRSRYGLAVRAAADDPARAAQLGVPVRRAGTLVWIVAAGLAAAAVSLQVPILGLAGGQGHGLLLRALAAAVVARMVSLPVALVAGLATGVIDQVVYSLFGGSTPADVLYAVLIVVALLLVKPLPGRTFRPAQALAPRGRVHPAWALPAVVPVFLGEGTANRAATVAIYAIVVVSVVVVAEWAGELSLGQFGLAGVGAVVAGRLTADAGVAFPTAALAGALAAGLASVLLGLATLRVRGLGFAVATLGFAVAVHSAIPLLAPRARPALVASDRVLYVIVVIVLGLVMLGLVRLRRTRTGRAALAVRDDPASARVYGISPIRVRLTCFAVAGMVAGLGGALLAVHQHAVTASSFPVAESIAVLTMAVVGGAWSPAGAVLGAVVIRGSTLFLPADFSLLLTGAGLIAVLLLAPGGLAALRPVRAAA